MHSQGMIFLNIHWCAKKTNIYLIINLFTKFSDFTSNRVVGEDSFLLFYREEAFPVNRVNFYYFYTFRNINMHVSEAGNFGRGHC